jgi:hypothetical protein
MLSATIVPLRGRPNRGRPTSRTFLGDMWSRREPAFCSSTVVSGSGFLWHTVVVISDRREERGREADRPLLGRLVLDAEDLGLRVLDALLVEDDARLKVEQVIARPLEDDLVVVAFLRDVDEPERLADEGLDLEVAGDDEAERRELARACQRRSSSAEADLTVLVNETGRTVANDLLVELGKGRLKGERLHAGDGRAGAEVELLPGLYRRGREHVEGDRVAGRVVDLTEMRRSSRRHQRQVSSGSGTEPLSRTTHAGIMALKRERRT